MQRTLLWVVFGLYALFILYGITNHEPWRDEAQSWLLVRDLGVMDLLKILPQEAHPPLWYFILMPFAKLGCPYQTEAWITGLLMIASVFILFFKTELPWYVKVTLAFSYFFFFEYALISRNYCLVILFITWIIAQYRQRFDRPFLFALLIIGLFNSHVIAFTLAGAFAGIYLLDMLQYKKANGRTMGAFALMMIGGLYLIPYFLLTKDSASYAHRIKDHMGEITKAINSALFVYEPWPMLSIVVLVILGVLLINRTKPLLLLLGGLVSVFYILGYKYVGTLRHQGILFAVVYAAYGIAAFYKDDTANMKFVKADLPKYGMILLALIALYQVKTSVAVFQSDAEQEFSGAKGAAEFIKENNLEGKIIVGHPTYAASAVNAFFPKGVKFYNPDCNRYSSYVVYDSCFFTTSNNFNSDYAAYTALTHFGQQMKDVLLLVNMPLQDPQFTAMFEPIYSTMEQPLKKDEGFIIYKLKQPK